MFPKWGICANTLARSGANRHNARGVAQQLYVSSVVPNKWSLGAANGLSQAATSIRSAIGPAAADWIFAFSLMHNVLGRNLAYFVLVGVM